MATFKTDRAAEGIQPYVGNSGEMCVAYGTYEWTTAPADGDKLELCKLPAGAQIIGAYIFHQIMDTDGTPTASVELGTETAAGQYMLATALSSADLSLEIFDPLLGGGIITETEPVTVTATYLAPTAFQSCHIVFRMTYVMP